MIYRSPLVEFQRLIYQHLKSYGAPVYDELHNLLGFPRIVIGEFSGKKEGSKSTSTQQVLLTLHLYTSRESEGKEEMNKLINNTIQCLSKQLPEMDNCFSLLSLQVDNYEVYALEDSDGNFYCYHASMDLEAKIQDFQTPEDGEIKWS